MIRNFLRGWKTKSQPHWSGTRQRHGRNRRPLRLERLEDRRLLSGGPTIYTVTNTSGLITPGSLVYAIGQANHNPNPAGSMIEFSGLFSTPQTITLKMPLAVTGTAGPITIAGPGANLLTVSGDNAVEVFDVGFAVTGVFSGLTISGGSTPGDNGGGVENAGTLTLSSSTIENNAAGSGLEGGGVYNDGVMTLSGCTITNNKVGGIGANGGGIDNSGTLLVSYSTIASNSADQGGGISNSATLTIADSTVADNSADSLGGGIYNSSSLTAVNTTIADNAVVVGSGGGLYAAGGTTTTLDNTIVALNTVDGIPGEIGGSVSTTSSYNLIGQGGAFGGLSNGVKGNHVGVTSPGLGSLANNGGPTQTIALLPGSPAVDAGSNALDGLATDQRGLARIYHGTIDIGAYELQPATVTAVSVYWGVAGAAALQTASDGLRLLPAGRSTDLPWYGIDKLQITFDEPETLTAAEVTLMSVKGITYGPVTVTGSGENYMITLARPITRPDRVTIVLAGAGIATYTRELDVLPGDFDDYGVVNRADLRGVRYEYLGVTPYTIFGDVLGDGTVDAADLKEERRMVGRRLPRDPSTPLVVLGRSLARELKEMRHHHH
jgi:hypothetical protein